MKRSTWRSLGVPAIIVGLVAMCLPSGQAWALSIDGSGTVTDWGVRPFPSGSTVADRHYGWQPSNPTYRTRWLEQNNYAPVSYPSGIGNLPSPGGANGEKIDLEGLYARINTGSGTASLQVLLVTSMDDHMYYSSWNRWYRLGDLFIDTNADGRYDYAVATTDWDNNGGQPWRAYDPATDTYRAFDHGAAPGSVYAVNYDPADPIGGASDVVTIVGPGTGGYGENATVEGAVRPWAVDEGRAAPVMVAGQPAVATLAKASFDYGGSVLGGGFYGDDEYPGAGVTMNENGTWVFEWTVPLPWIDPGGNLDAWSLDTIGLHLAVECGNDMIEVPGIPQVPTGHVPEPATFAGLLLAAGAVGSYLRRRTAALGW